MSLLGGNGNAPCSAGSSWHKGGEEGDVLGAHCVFSPTSDYFSAYLGEYRNVLSALETLNSAVLAAMDKTKLVRMRQEGG